MRNLIYIIVIAALTFCNFAYAGSSANSVNSNLNNNKNNNANFNALIPILNSDSQTYVDNADNFPVSSAYSSLTRPTSDCMGSVSAGGQGQYFGLSLGFNKQSKECNIRAYAKIFADYPEIAYRILCQSKYVKKALKDAGYDCKPVRGPLEQKKCKYPSPDCRD